MSIISTPSVPISLSHTLSISEFFTKYNPDEVEPDKVVLADASFPRTYTYGGLRKQAAECAYALRHKFRLKEQDVVLVVLPNCVRVPRSINGLHELTPLARPTLSF